MNFCCVYIVDVLFDFLFSFFELFFSYDIGFVSFPVFVITLLAQQVDPYKLKSSFRLNVDV